MFFSDRHIGMTHFKKKFYVLFLSAVLAVAEWTLFRRAAFLNIWLKWPDFCYEKFLIVQSL
jgi:hypothetical protein